MVVQIDDGYVVSNAVVFRALAALAFICLFLFLTYPKTSGFRYRYRQKRKPFGVVAGIAPPLGDSADQLRHVMAAAFHKKKVMNKEEYRVFRIVEGEVQAQRNGCRVLSQTSLGEIIGSDDKKAFDSVNSKRVDILIMGPYGDPIAAIEYQGAGHHQGTAAARDAIKREALRKAGVHFIEILADHSNDEIAQLVRRVFNIQEFQRSHANRAQVSRIAGT
jgi:Protein of unknown function (DUF2726)